MKKDAHYWWYNKPKKKLSKKEMLKELRKMFNSCTREGKGNDTM